MKCVYLNFTIFLSTFRYWRSNLRVLLVSLISRNEFLFKHLHKNFLSASFFLGNFILTSAKVFVYEYAPKHTETIIHKINERKESLRSK